MAGQVLRSLSGDDITRARDMREAIAAIRSAFVQITTGDATVPLRTGMELADEGSSVLLIPAHRQAGTAVHAVQLRTGKGG